MSRFVHVLSVRQPWAWLICAGFKGVENRTWKTGWSGALYIHAGKSFDWEAFERIPFRIATEVCRHFNIGYKSHIGCGVHSFDKSQMDSSEFGAIVGRVQLFGVVQNSTSKWAEPGFYHWIVRNPEQIDPIPLKGQLQIFRAEIPDEIKVIGDAGEVF